MSLKYILRITVIDLKRILSKKSSYGMLALFILPFIAALLLKKLGASHTSNEYLWTVILGLNLQAAMEGAIVGGISFVTVLAWWWLILGLYSGDMIASDMESGYIRLLLARPVKREEYLAGKILSTIIFLTFIAIIGSYSVYGAAWILAGHQADPLGPIIISLVLMLGSLPFITLAGLISYKTKKGSTGIILAVAVYIAAGFIVSMISLLSIILSGGGNMIEESLKIHMLLPFTGGKELASLYYTWKTTGPILDLNLGPGTTIVIGGKTINIMTGPIHVKDLLIEGIISTIIWTITITTIFWYLFKKTDL